MYVNRRIAPQNTYPQFSSKKEENAKKMNAPVLAATIAGTIIPMLFISKCQGRMIASKELKVLGLGQKAKAVLNSLNIEYGLNEMLYTSFGSIAGGLFGGLAFNRNSNSEKKVKIKESVFQFSNIAIPTSIVAGLLKLSEKSKSKNATLLKIASVAVGVGAGMPLAAAISNNINNSIIDKNNPDKRKLRLKDAFVHVDDLVGAVALTKMPLLDKLPIDKLLPFLYAMCGYESGVKE